MSTTDSVHNRGADVQMLPTRQLVVDVTNVRGEGCNVDDLTLSVAAQGVLQPLLVRPRGSGTYGVVAGQRRLAAARNAGLDEVPCVIRDMDDAVAAVASATENLGRSDLDPITEAETYRTLLDVTGATQQEIAGRLGVAPSTLSGRLQLLELPEDLQEAIRAGDMTVQAAKSMVRKARAARRDAATRTPSRRIASDNVDMLDVVTVDAHTVRRIRRHIDQHFRGDSVAGFVMRALLRELERPSCHTDGCWNDAVGGGRACMTCFQKAARPQTRTRKGCGTDAGYTAHRRRGGEPCQACREAHAAAQRRRQSA